jgi:hypothetical protein
MQNNSRTIKVPITKIHVKNLDEMLDTRLKIGKITVLSSVYRWIHGIKLFPNDCQNPEFPRIQCSTAHVCCNASVPFGTATTKVEEEWSREGSTDTQVFVCWLLSQLRFLSFLNNSVKNSHS